MILAPDCLKSGKSQIGLALAASLIAAAGLAVPLPFVPLGISLAILGVLAAFYYPYHCCVIFFVFSFFRIHEAFPFLAPLRLPLAFGALTSMAVAWHIFVTRRVKPFFPIQIRAFLFFLALVILGIGFAKTRSVAFEFFMGSYWKIALMTLALAWLPRSLRDLEFAVRLFVLCGILISLVAIYNKMAGIGLVEGTRVTIGRDLDSPIGDPNDLALVLLFPLSFAGAFLITRTGGLNTLLGLIGTPTIIFAIICTQSRGGLIGISVVLAVIGSRIVRSKMLLCGLGLVFALGFYTLMGISERVSGGAQDAENAAAIHRFYAWRAGLNMALSRPLSGVGLNNFRIEFYLYSPVWVRGEYTAHSTWFLVLGETGFLGFAAFATMVITCIVASVRRLGEVTRAGAPRIVQGLNLGMVGALAGFCASGSFLSQAYTFPIYVLLAMTVALSRFSADAVRLGLPQPSRPERSVLSLYGVGRSRSDLPI